MIRKLLLTGFAVASLLLFSGHGFAVAFTASDLIADHNFDNVGTMNAVDINNWLNTMFGSGSCISSSHGFSSADPTGYSPTGGYTYGGPVSAGEVIYHAAQAYGINPQVLLTTLQKEEGVVVGDGPYGCGALAMSAAAGYACTDSDTASHTYNYTDGHSSGTLPTPLFYINGSPITSVSNTCVNSPLAAGFSEQVIHAAWLLKFGEQRSKGNTAWNVQFNDFPVNGDHWDNSDDPNTCYYGPMTQGNFKRCSNDVRTSYFDGNTPIDSSSTYMSDGGTAGLYWYTPHLHGNQSFFNVYTNWFGSPTDYYADNNSSIAVYADNSKGQTVNASTMNAYTRYWVVLSFRNNGSTVWTNSGANPVRAAIMNGTYAFQDGSWINGSRTANMDQTTVGPGGTATFSFWYDAPLVDHVSDYGTQFGLVAENLATMGGDQPTLYTRVYPPTYYDSNSTVNVYTDSSKAQSTNANGLKSTDKVWVVMSFRNNGSAIWHNSGNGAVRLAANESSSPFCDATDAPSWINCARAADMDQTTVGPGGTATFGFWYSAPLVGHISDYASQFKLVSEGVASIEGTTPTVYTRVTPLLYAVNNSSVATYSTNTSPTPTNGLANTMTSGSRIWLVMSFRNNGNTVWKNTGSYPVHLAIMDNQPAAFQDNSWISGYRVVGMDQSSVGPGGTATFSFWYHAPTVSHGSAYATRFGLVAETMATMVGDQPVVYTYVNP